MRKGAMFSGYPAANWTSTTSDKTCSPNVGIATAGIKVYKTSFNLNLPTGVDVPVALKIERTPSSNYRSVIYINGWQFGRFSSNFGPQTVFPVSAMVLACGAPRSD